MNTNMKTIPKTIHYCWFGNNEKTELAKKCIESWRKNCPDYKIIEWNESNFDVNFSRFTKEAYEKKKWAFVSDCARLKIIYENGGIYFDTDVELIGKMDPFLNCEGFFSTEDNVTISTGLGFGAIKGNKLVKKMLDDYMDTGFVVNGNHYMDEPCPIRNSKSIKTTLDSLGNRNGVCESDGNYFYGTEFFCPYNNRTRELCVTEKTVAIHHYAGSWLDKKEIRIKKNRQKICKLFGPKVGEKICKLYTFPHKSYKRIKTLGIKKTITFYYNKYLLRKGRI